jgi:hypothetical protein
MIPRQIPKMIRKEVVDKRYVCWGCSTTYENSAEFLWHIQNCSHAKK